MDGPAAFARPTRGLATTCLLRFRPGAQCVPPRITQPTIRIVARLVGLWNRNVPSTIHSWILLLSPAARRPSPRLRRPLLLPGLAYSLFYQPGIHFQWDGFQLFEGLGVPALPLLIWSIHRLHGLRNRWAFCGAALTGVTLAFAANYFEAIFFPLLVLFWLVCIAREFDWKTFGILFCMAAGWLAVQAPQIIAASQFAPLSHRSDMVITSDSNYVHFIENVTNWPRQIFNSNAMLIAIGAVGLAFAPLSRSAASLDDRSADSHSRFRPLLFLLYRPRVFSSRLAVGLPFSSPCFAHTLSDGVWGPVWVFKQWPTIGGWNCWMAHAA